MSNFMNQESRNVGKIPLCFLVFWVLNSVASAAEPRDGNWWARLNADRKKSYAVGLIDGISSGQVAAINVNASRPESVEPFNKFVERMLAGLTNDQIVSGLNALYADFRNRHVPVYEAVWVVAMAAKGATPEEAEGMLAKLRASR